MPLFGCRPSDTVADAAFELRLSFFPRSANEIETQKEIASDRCVSIDPKCVFFPFLWLYEKGSKFHTGLRGEEGVISVARISAGFLSPIVNVFRACSAAFNLVTVMQPRRAKTSRLELVAREEREVGETVAR